MPRKQFSLSVLPGWLLLADPAARGPVHDGMDEVVNGVDDEGDGPQPQTGHGPLPPGLGHGGQRAGQAI